MLHKSLYKSVTPQGIVKHV